MTKIRNHYVGADDNPRYAVEPTATVSEAAKLMTDHNIGAALVMEGDDLVGIFTERDILTRIVALGKDPKTVKVSDVMTPEVICIQEDTSAMRALELMDEKAIRHLPVLSKDGKVRTVISIRNLYRLIQDDLEFDIHQKEAFIFGSSYGTGA